MLVVGPRPAIDGWDASWRAQLVENLAVLAGQLEEVGIPEVSSRRPFPGYSKQQLPMWHRYRVELYPHYGQGTGIRDSFGHELEFPSAFRLSRRDDEPRGIIKPRRRP